MAILNIDGTQYDLEEIKANIDKLTHLSEEERIKLKKAWTDEENLREFNLSVMRASQSIQKSCIDKNSK